MDPTQPTPSGAQDQLRRMTGEFVAPSLERRYRISQLEEHNEVYTRIAFGLAAVFPLFSLVDLASLGVGAAWLLLLGGRLVTSLLTFAVGRLGLRDAESFVVGRGRALLVVTEATAFLTVLGATALRPQDAITNTVSVVVVMLAVLLLVPAPFRDQLSVSVGLLVGYVAVSVWRFDDPPLPLVPLVANLAGALLLGMEALRLTNVARRRSWRAADREQAANERLNAELATSERLRSELLLLSRQDSLTQAVNRREFLRLASERLSSSDSRPLALLVMDADRFKSINDRFGHAAGDAALVSLVAATRGVVRPADVVGRLGGEEFAVLMPDMALPDALAAAERVRAAIARDRRRSGLPGVVTVSVGVAEHRPGDSVGDLLEQADAAMYEAKRRGGNRVACAAATDRGGAAPTGRSRVGGADSHR